MMNQSCFDNVDREQNSIHGQRRLIPSATCIFDCQNSGVESDHEDLGLPKSGDITGNRVKSVEVKADDDQNAKITITYADGIPGMKADDTLIYKAQCKAGTGLTWSIDENSSVPPKLRPKV